MQAQDTLLYGDPESGFALMRQRAEAGDYAGAKDLGYRILSENEAYYDVALYLARVHGWDREFIPANRLVDTVISLVPGLYEAYEVCFDLARWESSESRMEFCRTGAGEQFPDSATLLDRQLPVEGTGGEGIPVEGAGGEGAEVLALYSYDHFSRPYARNWHMMTLGLRYPMEKLALLPYLNAGIHPGDGGLSGDFQLNLDAYLTLGDKNYAMAGYGFSPDGAVNYLPVHRAAAELWQVLPAGFGLSAGFRYFYWEDHFAFLTFSAEKYAGNYWFNFRNYLFFKDYGVSGSYYLSARRYFAGRHDHLTLALGYGTAPDEPLVVISDLDRLNAFSVRLSLSKELGPRIRAVAALSYAREEYDEALSRNRWGFQAGCYYRIGP